MVLGGIGSLVKSVQWPYGQVRNNPKYAAWVTKAGMGVRCVVWPTIFPLGLYTWIRQKDRDMFALELLAYRSKTEYPEEFYDKTKGEIELFSRCMLKCCGRFCVMNYPRLSLFSLFQSWRHDSTSWQFFIAYFSNFPSLQ